MRFCEDCGENNSVCTGCIDGYGLNNGMCERCSE